MSARSKRVLLAAALAGAAAVVGCGSNNDTITAIQPVPVAQLLVVHVSPDAPKVDVALDGMRIGGSIAYANATGYMNEPGATAHLVVTASSGGARVLDATVPVAVSTSYSVFACDSLAQLKTLVLTDELSAVPAGQARVRFVNLAAGQPPLKIAITGGDTLVAGLGFMQSSPWMLLNAGDYDFDVIKGGIVGPYASATGVAFASERVYTMYVRGKGKSGLPEKAALVQLAHR